ncbi:MAG: hypothetical protein ABL912_07105 [Novosphingobium sp.]
MRLSKRGRRHWSSAPGHIVGERSADDPLTDLAVSMAWMSNWRAMLRHG